MLLKQDLLTCSLEGKSQHDLVQALFGRADRPPHDLLGRPRWHSFAYITDDRRCVATAEACAFRLLADGRFREASGIRLVGVAEDWRGRGLFRGLLERIIGWSAQRGLTLLFLYTAEHALYRRFGFAPVPQYAFIGDAPAPLEGSPARTLDLRLHDDIALVERLLASRTPISRQLALIDAPALVWEKL